MDFIAGECGHSCRLISTDLPIRERGVPFCPRLPLPLLCGKTFHGEMLHTFLLTSDREPTKYGYHQSSAWGTMGFHQVTYKNIGSDVTYMCRNDTKIATSPKHTPAWVTPHNLEHTAQPAGGQQAALSMPLSQSTPLPGRSAGFCFLWAGCCHLRVFFSALLHLNLRGTLSFYWLLW